MSEAVAKSDLYCVCVCVLCGVSSSKQTAASQDAAATVVVAAEDAIVDQ